MYSTGFGIACYYTTRSKYLQTWIQTSFVVFLLTAVLSAYSKTLSAHIIFILKLTHSTSCCFTLNVSKYSGWVANRVHSDQMPQYAASDLSPHSLPRHVCPNTYGKYGTILAGDHKVKHTKFKTGLILWHVLLKDWKQVAGYNSMT